LKKILNTIKINRRTRYPGGWGAGLEYHPLPGIIGAARLLGQPATVTFSALNTSTPGTVTAMDLASTVTNNVVEYGVTVTLDSPPTGLRLGQTASVSITTGTKASVLYVPSSSITTVGPLKTVTLRKAGKDTPTTVQTGFVGDSGTEITSGLAEGDVVVLSASSGGTGGGFTFPGGGLGGAVSGGLGQ